MESKQRRPSRLSLNSTRRRAQSPQPSEPDAFLVTGIQTNSPPPHSARARTAQARRYPASPLPPPANHPRRRERRHAQVLPPPPPPPPPPDSLPENYDDDDESENSDDDFQEPTPRKRPRRAAVPPPLKQSVPKSNPVVTPTPKRRVRKGKPVLMPPPKPASPSNPDAEQKRVQHRPASFSAMNVPPGKRRREKPSTTTPSVNMPKIKKPRRHLSKNHVARLSINQHVPHVWDESDNVSRADSQDAPKPDSQNPSRHLREPTRHRRPPTPPDDETSSDDSDDFMDFDLGEDRPDAKHKFSELMRSQEHKKTIRRVDKALLDAIEMDRSMLTAVELDVLRVVWNRRPQPGASEQGKNLRKRGGWQSRVAIVEYLKHHAPAEVTVAIDDLVRRRVLETSEYRGTVCVRTVGAQLLLMLKLPEIRKIHRMAPNWQARRNGPKLKKQYIFDIRQALRGRAAHCKPPVPLASQQPTPVAPVARRSFKQLVVSEGEGERLAVKVADVGRVARIIMEEAGPCVRIRALVTKKIERLHWREGTDDDEE